MKNRILIKIGGSLIAPKNKESFIDFDYLKKISDFFRDKIDKKFSILHGTGNIGHKMVKKLVSENKDSSSSLKEVLIKNYKLIREKLDNYNVKIDNYFPFLNRYYPWDILKERGNLKNGFICGGDVDPESGNIISSDDIFAFLLKNFKKYFSKFIILTDVDGVLDSNNNVIKLITNDNFTKIKFRSKENDVTGGMKAKIEKILGYGPVYVLNGRNFKNLEKFFNGQDYVGTVIF